MTFGVPSTYSLSAITILWKMMNCHMPCRSRHVPSLTHDPLLKKLEGFDAKVFSKAPAEVMLAALNHVRSRHGSIADYLQGNGFSVPDQELLASLLRRR